MNNIPLEKWLVMILLTVVSIFLGMLPYTLVRHTKSFLHVDSLKYQVILTILSCFGAGVLFCTSMLHLLPEVRESFHESDSLWSTFDEHFPLAEIVVICGFCLIYLVEEVAHFIMVDGHFGHHHMNAVARNNSLAHALPIHNAKNSGLTPRASIITHNSSVCITVTEASGSTANLTEKQNPQSSAVLERDSQSMAGTDCPDDNSNFASSLRTFLALIALSFHAIMEGITIGLQNSSNVWVMFGAVASHKFVISFCMGMELVTSQTKLLAYLASILFFAILSPVGIIIGSLLASDETTDSVAVTVIEGLACGTLLYVVFFEILSRERERKSFSMSGSKAVGFIQFLSLGVGLVGMGCLLTLTHNSHPDDIEHTEDHSSHEHRYDFEPKSSYVIWHNS